MLGDLKYKLQDMFGGGGFREWINNNSAVVTVAAVAILIVSLAVIINQGRGRSGPNTPGNAFFYDTVTKKVFTDDATKIPPIQSPDGNPAVRAHFFTCGDCADESDRFLGYYEKYTDDVKAQLEANPQAFELYEMAYEGRLYSADGENWVTAESPDGIAITQALQGKCPPKKLRYCPPQK